MIFQETSIPGAFIIDIEAREDDRGFFARAWCRREFETRGLMGRIEQVNIAHNRRRHTLRGLHFQAPPHEEEKVIRCVRGAVHLVLVDLRRDLSSYKRQFSVALSGDNYRMMVVPKGCANGYLTLADDSELLYFMSAFYTPGAERGIRWNDPRLGMEWPVSEPAVISPKDLSWPDFEG
jgi:dTDP-4-dehydrorhamnose 3,5-epimerase